MSNDLKNIIEKFPNINILVIGDIIVDEYVTGTAIGKSSEAPVLVMKKTDTIQYIGGAAIVARHIKALGGNVKLLSVIGEDKLSKVVEQVLDSESVDYFIQYDKNRHTSLKQRFVADNYKLLRVSDLNEDYISKEYEDEIIDQIKAQKNIDGIIISDFNYGVVTKRILKFVHKYANENNIKLFGDTQSSSQIGNCLQFKDYCLITPTEKEARIALRDEHSPPKELCLKLKEKTNSKNICLTLGSEGLIGINEKENMSFPALNDNGIEKMGCGDALLAAMVLAMCLESSLKDSCFLGSVMAAIKLTKIGNVPVSKEELIKSIRKYKEKING